MRYKIYNYTFQPSGWQKKTYTVFYNLNREKTNNLHNYIELQL